MNLFSGWPAASTNSMAAAHQSALLKKGNSGGRVLEMADASLTAADGSQSTAPAPFLTKTYEMVDDPSSDAVVSWSSSGNSFIVWKPPEFSRDLLPKYFKHNNFSSFVRQLNTYGFRKVDQEKWEFANEEGFRKGKRQLLNNIHRRKPSHSHSQSQPAPQGQGGTAGPCVEVGKFGLEQEVERLKRDKNVLMMELVRVRQQKQQTERELQLLVQRYQVREQRQQKMISFFARAIDNPSFFAQLVKQNEQPALRKKRRFSSSEETESDSSEAKVSTGFEMVRYQGNANNANVKGTSGGMFAKILSSASSVPKMDTLDLMVEKFEHHEGTRRQESEGSPQSGISLIETADCKLSNASVDSRLSLPPASNTPTPQTKPATLALKHSDSGGLANVELSLSTKEAPANLSSKKNSRERFRTAEDACSPATTSISQSGPNDLFWEKYLTGGQDSHNSETKLGVKCNAISYK